ncbi:MAG: helix-turn-helix transcriptional regulator [Bacillota bacterium]|nr:helix-turn-helix transcriptional regulator [Bacillota bacterium]
MQYIRIEHLRLDNDYTQEYVAYYLGIQREVYRRYEKGTRTIPDEPVIRLADLYNTTTDYILGRTSNSQPIIKKVLK